MRRDGHQIVEYLTCVWVGNREGLLPQKWSGGPFRGDVVITEPLFQSINHRFSFYLQFVPPAPLAVPRGLIWRAVYDGVKGTL